MDYKTIGLLITIGIFVIWPLLEAYSDHREAKAEQQKDKQ